MRVPKSEVADPDLNVPGLLARQPPACPQLAPGLPARLPLAR